MSGVLLVLLGLWGGLVPLLGHYFNFVIGPDRGFDFTAGRVWLSILPAVATIVGGLIVVGAANRAGALLGAWLAMAGGAWFVVGNPVSELWNHGVRQAGPALGGQTLRVIEELTYFYGLGALILAIASFAFGRLAIRSVRDAELAREDELAADRYDRKRDAARRPAVPPREPAVVQREQPVVVERDPVPSTTAGPQSVAGDTAPAQTRTMSAADRVETASADQPRRGRFFRRR